ncbi:hypothetical protein VTO42DRAFT_788 [Malbranchea cinnamomea]
MLQSKRFGYALLHEIRKSDNYGHDATPMREDNQGTLALIENPIFHSRSKHFHVRYHALRDYKRDLPSLLPTAEMLADGLTEVGKGDIGE